jgi:hypothetical protein
MACRQACLAPAVQLQGNAFEISELRPLAVSRETANNDLTASSELESIGEFRTFKTNGYQ